MGWFKRFTGSIKTSTREKKEVPDGLWTKCPSCGKTSTTKELEKNLYVCPNCDYHGRIGANEYFSILFEEKKYKHLFSDIKPVDFLEFTDLKSYNERIKETTKKTKLNDAMQVAAGDIFDEKMICACMDFSFIGGSMGSVVGEKIARSVDYAIKHQTPLLIISKSGGARMMESAFSLMQMAKTAAKLTQLDRAKVPYISLMTDPTTGGVTASYAMLGDLNIAEPGSLIGFAGPRVIKETIKKDLPEGFQTAEFLLEKGFLDFIVKRSELKKRLYDVIKMLK